MGAADWAPPSPMSFQPSFASPAQQRINIDGGRDRDGDISMWLLNSRGLENVDPNTDDTVEGLSPLSP